MTALHKPENKHHWYRLEQAKRRLIYSLQGLRLPVKSRKEDPQRGLAFQFLEDVTPERRVFQGVTEATAYQTMTRACQTAGVPHYHPHDLCHRRISLWHQSGVTARELAERAGHARPSMSLDVYSHVMPAGEVADERLLALL